MEFDLDLRVLAVITPSPFRCYMMLNGEAQRRAMFTPLCDLITSSDTETHKIERVHIEQEEEQEDLDLNDPNIRNMTIGELMDRRMNPQITPEEFDEILFNVIRWIHNA